MSYNCPGWVDASPEISGMGAQGLVCPLLSVAAPQGCPIDVG